MADVQASSHPQGKKFKTWIYIIHKYGSNQSFTETQIMKNNQSNMVLWQTKYAQHLLLNWYVRDVMATMEFFARAGEPTKPARKSFMLCRTVSSGEHWQWGSTYKSAVRAHARDDINSSSGVQIVYYIPVYFNWLSNDLTFNSKTLNKTSTTLINNFSSQVIK